MSEEVPDSELIGLEQIKDQIALLKSLIQRKDDIIENLQLRYDLGILAQDPNRIGCTLSSDEFDTAELGRKAEAVAQRSILENFELRDMANELRDENYHLRNEIYEQVLDIYHSCHQYKSVHTYII